MLSFCVRPGQSSVAHENAKKQEVVPCEIQTSSDEEKGSIVVTKSLMTAYVTSVLTGEERESGESSVAMTLVDERKPEQSSFAHEKAEKKRETVLCDFQTSSDKGGNITL